MSTVKMELMVEMLKMARQQTLDTAKAVMEENRLKQLKEGKATPLWLIGHLANSYNTVYLVRSLGHSSIVPKELSVKFAPDFVGGTVPTTNPEDYPSWDEVVALYEKAITNAIEGTKKLNDDDWEKPLPGNMPEPMRSFFSSIGRTLEIMVMHDAHHRGQIALLGKL